jgi:2-phosphosulfolactate phosphatase
MIINVNVEFLAKDATKAVRRGDLIIVIDVLRCSSTIVTALSNGAKAIIPTKTLREARKLHVENPEYLLAGERGGLKPPGFDLGNSPLEYVHERVSGKTIILTTTSGTLALTNSRNAKWVLVGSFLNAKAVAEKAFSISYEEGIGISIVQAGTKGRFSLEDFICAGAILSMLPEESVELSDPAQAALLSFKYAENDLYANLVKSEHSKKLMSLGFSEDIKFSSQINVYSTVPLFRGGIITKIS